MDAFTALCERHYRDVYRFALFLTGDPVHGVGDRDVADVIFQPSRTAVRRLHG